MKGIDPKTHEGVERMISLYYVKTKEIDLSAGKAVGRLMKMGQEADYYPEVPFSEEEAAEAIGAAEGFLLSAKTILAH